MGVLDIFKINAFKSEIKALKSQNEAMQTKLNELGARDYFQVKEMTDTMRSEYDEEKTANQRVVDQLKAQIETLQAESDKLTKNNKTQANKLNRSKELVKAIDYACDNYLNYESLPSSIRLSKEDHSALDELSPSVILKLHCMDIKDLRKAYRDNDKQINSVLEKYSSRYTTKANQAIYKLMVIALRAELQNILYNLKYEKLDDAIEEVKSVTQKYLQIASDGNQSISGTLKKFIGEIEYLFINAVKIEYNYYVKKEQAKQEQQAIREQMRQEAEERKALEAERKKVEKEETKYNTEIAKIQEQLSTATDEELAKLNARILELQSQLADVIVKKDEITNLANGKAGNVYIISNLGSFGEDVFKIGMTRRLNPQDRVNELGDASVPFKFDVHSFIFSDDAVGLESKLHEILNNRRVNKVNLRKEFFRISIDELETLVTSIDPTAEFNKTMLAEEFRQSLSSDENYSDSYVPEDYDEE